MPLVLGSILGSNFIFVAWYNETVAAQAKNESDGDMMQSQITLARESAGLTQAELARRIGVSRQQLHNWETGFRNPKLDALVLIAEALHVPLESLVNK